MIPEYIKQLLRAHKTKHPKEFNFWIERYIKFIEKCQEKYKNLDSNIPSDRHHIFPRSWDKEEKYIRDKNNIVRIPIKAHIIAHHIISRTKDKAMITALKYVISNNKESFNYVITTRIVTEYKKKILRPVMNLDTHQTFQTTLLACNYYGDDKEHLRQCIRDNARYKGSYWQYVDLLENTTPEQENERLRQLHFKTRKPVVRISDGKIFETHAEAQRQNNCIISMYTNRRYGGSYWQYLEKFDEQHDLEYWRNWFEQNRKANKDKREAASRAVNSKKVIDIDTDEIWNSAKEASLALGLKPTSVATRLKAKNCITIAGRHLKYLDET